MDQKDARRVLSASQLDLYHNQCQRLWAWRYLAGLRSPDTQGKARGQCLHWCNEMRLAAGRREVEPLAATTWTTAMLTPDKASEILQSAIPELGGEGAQAEVEFRIPIGKTEFDLFGKIDWVRQLDKDCQGNLLVNESMEEVGDLKTVSSYSYCKDVLELMNSWQGLIYPVARLICSPSEWTMVKCKWVYVKTTRDRATGTYPPPKPVEWWVPRQRAKNDVKKILDACEPLIHHYRRRPDPVSLTANHESCDVFGGCPFRDRCFAGLKGQTMTQPQNPQFPASQTAAQPAQVQQPQPSAELLEFLQRQAQVALQEAQRAQQPPAQQAQQAPAQTGWTIDQIANAPGPMFPPAPHAQVLIKATNPQHQAAPVAAVLPPEVEKVQELGPPGADAQSLREEIERLQAQLLGTTVTPPEAPSSSPGPVAADPASGGVIQTPPARRGRGRPRGSKTAQTEQAVAAPAPEAPPSNPTPTPLPLEHTQLGQSVPPAPCGVAVSPTVAGQKVRTLYVNCAPARRVVPWVFELPQFAAAVKAVCASTGAASWDLVDYGKGPALLANELAKLLPTVEPTELRVSMSMRSCQALVDLLVAAWADEVVTAAS